MSRTIVTIEEVRALQERRREINRIDLKDIDFYENGVIVTPDKDVIEEWCFTGLSNIDFVEMVLD